MRYETGETVVLLKDTGRFKKGQIVKIVSVVVAEPELQDDGTFNNPLFHVESNTSGTLLWGEGGVHEPDCRHYYPITNPCGEIPLVDENNKPFLSQTKTKSENGKHNRTKGSLREVPGSERERERRGTDPLQGGRSKLKLASGSFADTQRAVKCKSKVGRVKIKFST